MDTDMLAAIEDLLDTWPGTLIVVSHDRYLIERVTDQQYAVMGHRLRHLPGGIDEYLKLAKAEDQAAQARTGSAAEAGDQSTALTGAERQALVKARNAAERRLAKANDRIQQIERAMADVTPDDYEKLAALGTDLRAARDEVEECEIEWLEAAEALEG